MNMKKHIFTALLLAAVSTLAQAQAINPTVEVTNVFDGKLLDIHKPAREMDVPDSLMNFDLKFDYSVFDNPYKGVYEFKPYLVDMTPAPDGFDGRRIYLRTGAGYALNPVFDFVWSPFGSGPFTLNVYASHQSYIGKYRRVFASPKSDEDNTIRLVSNHEKAKFSTDEEDIKGYDISNKAGVNGRFQWDSGELDFKAGYYGLNSSVYDKSNYNAGDVAFGVRSKDLGGSYMYYDANLAYRYGTDDVLFDAKGNYRTLDMQDIRFFGTFGPVIGGSNRLLIDASMGMTFYSGLFKTSTGNFNFTPRYVLDLDRINLSLGVKVSMSINNKNVTYGGFVVNPDKGQLVYPAVHADVAVVPDWLDVYASVTGGDSLNDYSSLKDANHFFHADYGRGYGPFSDLTAERVNARLGFRGNITPKFR